MKGFLAFPFLHMLMYVFLSLHWIHTLPATGPTAIMALMVQRYVSTSPDFAILSAFLTGLIILLFGLLNLGTYE